MTELRWLLLIHQIPPKPDYLRVKVWRRLQRDGAVAIKNSVYVLPRSDQALEAFQWTLREIVESGGDAWICEAGFVEGISNEQIAAMFRAARDADYAAISNEARDFGRRIASRRRISEGSAELEAAVTRLRQKLGDVTAIDFFDALGRQSAEGLVASLEKQVRPDTAVRKASELSLSDYRARVWVTRKGVHVDRMASVWLIKRFIDRRAKFKFVSARGYQPKSKEIRFDMFEADFTHEGDRCTFEVLIRRFGLRAAGLMPVAEIVHDIDLRDDKFGRPETAGIERLITGVCIANPGDDRRIKNASVLFDRLYESFSEQKG